jgi:hypothetical protein
MTEFIACLNSTVSNANCVQVALQYHGDPVFHQLEEIQTGLMQWLKQM